ncbi:hypothetical protein OTK49_03440 [Vibrio coralliirubri]|uniref:hypothetical protein n=1 Tax=Vibrio coralliirubri TaxID=1516159 RepID=UPI002284875E|nr:hypothetical protein [Vibrio coralliirubri]MCY9861571.1 hypothetical protein [Vibrio coralliirubri]
MGIIVEVDYHNGVALPDGKVVEWASNLVEQASKSSDDIVVSASTMMMITALQVASKGKPSGFSTLHYPANGIKVEIDSDGNITGLSGLDEEFLAETLLMELI